MPYVFVVNQNTFKCHLEYMFAGTGSRDSQSPFLEDREAKMNGNTEKNLVGMIADISGIRKGDKIIFYLTSNNNCEGGFFGSFEAIGNAFFDENNDNQYLKEVLNKSLTYRIRIKPSKVYSKGVTEHEVLDNPDGINSPTDLCWTLIYRKLKANRGCTPITNREYDFIMEKIEKNNDEPLPNNALFTYNNEFNEITVNSIQSNFNYFGNTDSIDIKNRLLFKMINNYVLEVHLQAYIMQNFDKDPLLHLLFEENIPIWIANEVICSVGEQRIDIMSIQEATDHVYINIIELKRNEAYEDIILRQLPWYIQWTIYYIAEKYEQDVSIQPIILTAPTPNITDFPSLDVESFKKNNDNIKILPIRYISYTLDEDKDDITFQD